MCRPWSEAIVIMDEKFVRSKRYRESVMEIIMSRNGLEIIIAVIEEVTRLMDKVDKVSYSTEPESGLDSG